MKVGLFFGSFNPVHIGHLIIASHMVEYTSLDQVWFIVSPHNPFKNKSSLLNEYDRLHLVELAINEDIRLRANNVEFNLPQPSYTTDTLAYLYDKHPDHEFTLIMGSDNLEGFHKWKNYEKILKYHQVYVYRRAGYSGGKIAEHENIIILNVPLLNISASFIRKSIKNKHSVKYIVPEEALKYIREMHFYE